MTQKKRVLAAGLIAAILLIVIDQTTKYLAQTGLAGKRGVTLIPGVFELFYLENTGAAFGMFDQKQWFFVFIALVMAVASAYVYLRLPQDGHYHALRVICVLIAAGALGNMIDRVVHHYVIDFLYFSLIDFPVFNVADCYVCVGTAAAVILLFTVYRDDSFEFLR